jgi:hypothetical protein
MAGSAGLGPGLRAPGNAAPTSAGRRQRGRPHGAAGAGPDAAGGETTMTASATVLRVAFGRGNLGGVLGLAAMLGAPAVALVEGLAWAWVLGVGMVRELCLTARIVLASALRGLADLADGQRTVPGGQAWSHGEAMYHHGRDQGRLEARTEAAAACRTAWRDMCDQLAAAELEGLALDLGPVEAVQTWQEALRALDVADGDGDDGLVLARPEVRIMPSAAMVTPEAAVDQAAPTMAARIGAVLEGNDPGAVLHEELAIAGSIRALARQKGIAESTLRGRMRKLGIRAPRVHTGKA